MRHQRDNPLVLGAAIEAEQPAALRLAFGGLPRPVLERRIAEAMAVLSRTPDSPPLWVARRGGLVVGAVWVAIQMGRTALVVPPQLVAGEAPDTVAKLVAQVISHLQCQGVRLAQAMVEMDCPGQADALVANRFQHLGSLLYMVSLPASFPTAPPATELEFVPYSSLEHDRFWQVVKRTYEGSLDYPAIDGVRPVDEVLEGHRAVGASGSALWAIVRHRGSDLGCLLLADHPASDQRELVYMGVVSRVRGQGLGVSIVRQAQWLTRQARRGQLVLAVDNANAPAKRVYAACGFVTWDQRNVFVRVC